VYSALPRTDSAETQISKKLLDDFLLLQYYEIVQYLLLNNFDKAKGFQHGCQLVSNNRRGKVRTM